MGEVHLLIFAFLTGVVVSGLSASLVEAVLKQPASFSAPVFSSARPIRSLALSVVAGPAMLVNDALHARAVDRIGGAVMVSCFATAAFWSFATGVVSLQLIWHLVHL